MNSTERDKILNKAIDLYGEKHQRGKAVEELSELIQSLTKYDNLSNDLSKDCKAPPDDIYEAIKSIKEEMADVKIMLRQLEIIFGKVDMEIVDYKLQRMVDSWEGDSEIGIEVDARKIGRLVRGEDK